MFCKISKPSKLNSLLRYKGIQTAFNILLSIVIEINFYIHNIVHRQSAFFVLLQ